MEEGVLSFGMVAVVLVLHNDILQSKDKLFLINYTPQITLPARWFLVQVDLVSTSESNLNSKEQGIYY